MRPLVSYLVFGYNHERFIREALLSALAQDYEPIEIVITDDCSTDRTAGVIDDVLAGYGGPKSVTFTAHSVNVGFAESLNRAVARARGEILVLAAGDDISVSHRTAVLVHAFQQHPAAQCVYSNAEVIDDLGKQLRLHYPDPPPKKTVRSLEGPYTGLLGATTAYRKDLFKIFGSLPTDVAYEDRVLPLRAAMSGEVVYLSDRLVHYRRHGANIWNGIVHQIEELAEWRKHDAKVARGTLANLRARLSDIALGLKLFPEREADLLWLRSRTVMWIRRLEAQVAMFDTPTRVGKALVAARHILSGGAGGPRQMWGFLRKNFLSSVFFKQLKQSRSAREERLHRERLDIPR